MILLITTNLDQKKNLKILVILINHLKKKKTDISVLNKLIITFSCHEFAQVYSRQLLVAFKLDAKKRKDIKIGKNLSTIANIHKIQLADFLLTSHITRKKKLIIEISFLKDLIIFALLYK